ncbi:hypothetical protein GGI07_003057 [Coemansia sp. Benny D115]|nr:hypothetical protein GGI07_003057 [Coemansia sp. Benny D115]
MTSTKRARLDGQDNHHAPPGSQLTPQIKCLRFLDEENAVVLPTGIGRISAISTCAESYSFLETNTPSNEDNVRSRDILACIAVGTDAGCIALIHSDGTQTSLEESGGPAIQRLLVAKPATQSVGPDCTIPDVVAGDSEGGVSVFTMGRMVSRNTLSAPVSAMAANINPNTMRSYIIGDTSGVVSSCHTQGVLWRSQIYATENSSADGGVRLVQSTGKKPEPTSISSVCAVQFADYHGIATNYVLAASGARQIQLLSRDHLVLTLSIPAPCNHMCRGRFVISEPSAANNSAVGTKGNAWQVLLGDDAGWLHVLDRFKTTPYVQVDYPVTSIFSIPLRAFSDRDGPDVVVCATRSNVVYIIHDRKIVAQYTADFWPAAVSVLYSDSSVEQPALVLAENKGAAARNTTGILHCIYMDFVFE